MEVSAMADPRNSRDMESPNQAANRDPAEGSRENLNEESSGITNRPIREEQREQQNVPPRGDSKEGGHA
jgi:hypothetical protein